MPADAIVGVTPGTSGASSLAADAADAAQYANRAAEIRAWLAANPSVRRFVILDDRPSASDDGLAPHFVQTVAAEGISDADAERCRAILTGADGPVWRSADG